MSTTTPRFKWPIPTDSDFVRNGAAAMRSLGTAIDAATVLGNEWISISNGMVSPAASGPQSAGWCRRGRPQHS